MTGKKHTKMVPATILAAALIALIRTAPTYDMPTGVFDPDLLSKFSKLPPHLKSAPPEQCPISYVMHLIPAGYPFETHEVTTDDGYILTLFRLQKKSTNMKSGLPVVFIQHGLDNDAANWLQNGEQGLSFLLANAGFDVWLGNNRGCKFSRKHRTFSVSSKQFWTFSFDEMAEYDLPASLAYARQVSGAAKVTYIGHSQGTTQMFAALSFANIRPKVAPYINRFYALAPVVYLNHNTTPVPN